MKSNSKDYAPTRNFIVIRPELEEEKSAGGIVIPEQARRSLNEGEVLKCGPQVSTDISIGMFVVFTQSSEFRLQMDDGQLVFVVAEDNLILTRPAEKKLFPVESILSEKSRNAQRGILPKSLPPGQS